MSTLEWNRQLLDASVKLDEALEELDRATRQWATDDLEWRRSKARAHLKQKGESGLAAEKEAFAELESAESRYKAQLAEGLKSAALEAVRARRSQLSAIQSMVSLAKAEADLARYNPRELEPA